MKVLFAGPSLHGLAVAGQRFADTDILCLPPARLGDITRAVRRGASVVGLVDGRYEDVAAPWHKEILYALDQGLRVFGAASMGAIRAAECAAFGMVPIGVVAQRYIDGEITDDAAVAQIHGPDELGSLPLSEALVNVEASLATACQAGALSASDLTRLATSARSIFFKDLTLPTLVERAGFDGPEGEARVRILRAHWHDVKQEDALALVAAMRPLAAARTKPTHGWRFQKPSAWRRFLADLLDEETGPQG